MAPYIYISDHTEFSDGFNRFPMLPEIVPHTCRYHSAIQASKGVDQRVSRKFRPNLSAIIHGRTMILSLVQLVCLRVQPATWFFPTG